MEQSHRPMTTYPQKRVGVCIIVLLGLIGGSPWHSVFGWEPVAIRLFLASVVPGAVSVAISWRRPRALAGSVLVSLLALIWFLAIGVLGDSFAGVLPTFAAVSDTYHGLISGWSEILSVPLPVAGPREILVL